MKSTGIIRNTDVLGRIVLPKEIRDTMDLKLGTPIDIFIDETSIIIKKKEIGCFFCGNLKTAIEYKGKKFCKKCLLEL